MGTTSEGPCWVDHQQYGSTFDLTHLHPKFLDFSFPALPAKGKSHAKPALTCKVYITYSIHTFSTSWSAEPVPDESYEDSGRGEIRRFCVQRYQWSKRLPEWLRSLDENPIYATGHHNYFAVDLPEMQDGLYVAYMDIKAGGPTGYRIHVESAYCRSDAPHRTGSKQKTRLAPVLRKLTR